MMIAAGEEAFPSVAGEIIRDRLDAPRPTEFVQYEERWIATGTMGRGYWERRPLGGEWERVQS
jgi:hypothetical protein